MSNRQISDLILQVASLQLKRGPKIVYRDLTVAFSTGVTTLLGPNGAGKTTLLEGLQESRYLLDGSILFEGRKITSRRELREYYAHTGFMPQHWRYFKGFRVLEAVEYAAWLKGVPSGQLSTAAQQALAAVDLTKSARQPIRRLSGGMQQRVGLAESIVNQPKLLLLDEPTVGLDPQQRFFFRRWIESQRDKRAIVLSTHLIDDVAALADRIIIVAEGRVIFDDSSQQLASLGGASEDRVTALEQGYLSVISTSTAIS